MVIGISRRRREEKVISTEGLDSTQRCSEGPRDSTEFHVRDEHERKSSASDQRLLKFMTAGERCEEDEHKN